MEGKVPVMKMVMMAAAASLMFGAGAPASAEQGRNAKTPDNWSYEIKNGKRVPKVQRKMNPDGSWTEELRQGNCVVTRHGKRGEVHETRKCD